MKPFRATIFFVVLALTLTLGAGCVSEQNKLPKSNPTEEFTTDKKGVDNTGCEIISNNGNRIVRKCSLEPEKLIGGTSTSTMSKNACLIVGDVGRFPNVSTTNYGFGDTCYVGDADTINLSVAFDSRDLLQFPLPAEISGERVIKVDLFVYHSEFCSPMNIDAHQLTGGLYWPEDEVSWGYIKITPTTSWANAGGDYSATIIDRQSVTGIAGWTDWVLMGTGSDNPLTLTWGDTVNIILISATVDDTNTCEYTTRLDIYETGNVPYYLVESEIIPISSNSLIFKRRTGGGN
jgi:hypothetical protein